MRSKLPKAPPWLLLLLVVMTFGVTLYTEQGRQMLLSLLAWLDNIGPWAVPVFILIDMLVVIFLIPGVIVTLSAGFLFGPLKGSAYVIIATTVGATLAFLIARYSFRGSVRQYLLEHPKLKMIDDELAPAGWKFILLTRMIPFFPFKLTNYFFGLSSFRLWHFVVGTFFGIMPITAINVYVGSVAADLADLGLRGREHSTIEWIIYGFGLVALIVVAVYLTRAARHAMTRYIGKQL